MTGPMDEAIRQAQAEAAVLRERGAGPEVLAEQQALLKMAELYVEHQTDLRQGQRFTQDLTATLSERVDQATAAFDRYLKVHPPTKAILAGYGRPKAAPTPLPSQPFPLPPAAPRPASPAFPTAAMAPPAPAGQVTPDVMMGAAPASPAATQADREARVQAEIAAHQKKGQFNVRLEEKERPRDDLPD
jgi:hypothetical protein